MFWHFFFSHLNFKHLENLFLSFFIYNNHESFLCEIWQCLNIPKAFIQATLSITSFFVVIYQYHLWLPISWGLGGSFVDDHVRATWIFLMEDKPDGCSMHVL